MRASEQVEKSVKKLEEQGLKIGWQFYPYCAEGHSDQACNGSVGGMEKIAKFVAWFFMSTLAGVLIGLGGPFWFRVFTSLSQVFQALKVLGLGGRKTPKDEPPAEKTAVDPAKPIDVLDAFKVAVEVNLQSAPKAS